LFKLPGVNQNLLKLQGSKLKFSQITRGEICHEGPKQKKILQGRKKIKLQDGKLKMTYITKGKAPLTLLFF